MSVLGCAPGGPLVTKTRVVVRVPSRLRSSFVLPCGALHEIVPPKWPHTRRNLHTPPARRCFSALCHRPGTPTRLHRRRFRSTTRRDAVAHVLRQRRVRALQSQARSLTPRQLPLVCPRPPPATASSPAHSPCMVADAGASPLQVRNACRCPTLLRVSRAWTRGPPP